MTRNGPSIPMARTGRAPPRVFLLLVATAILAVAPFIMTMFSATLITNPAGSFLDPPTKRRRINNHDETHGKPANRGGTGLDNVHYDQRQTFNASGTTLVLKPSAKVFQEYLAYLQTKRSQQASSQDILREFPIRYYIYPGEAMAQKEHRVRMYVYTKRYGMEADYELDILEALEKHALRTVKDPSLADLFVIPTPITNILVGSKASDRYAEAFGALGGHEIWNQTGGHRHVMLALAMPVFDKKKAKFVRELSVWYNMLYNVTIAKNCDNVALYNMTLQEGGVKTHGFETFFVNREPITRSSFSIGLGITKAIPYHAATMEKFYNSTFLIFYQTRVEPSMKNSTQFRHAPLKMSLADYHELEPFSIGFGLPEEEWLEHFSSSKFCPVIRGDSPHSHALFRAIKMGCIPVIVSDLYKEYSPPFRSSLNMEDYCVIIDEDDFMANPGREFAKLKDLSTEEIQRKIQHLAFAQKVILPDHPDSLLVPALLRETLESIRRGSPSDKQGKRGRGQ